MELMRFGFQKNKETQTIYSLEKIISDIKPLTDEIWGMYAFSREPLEGKFNDAQKREYIRKSQECGYMEALLVKDHYGSMDLTEIVRLHELEVETPEVPGGGSHVIFAQYTEPEKIEIFMDSVNKAAELLEDSKIAELLENVSVYELLLAHELFHGIEYQKKRYIYTQIEKVELWKRPFSNKSKIIVLGEIAGMEFAKYITGISYSPFIFDVVLMYAYNKEAASMLYEDIMKIAEECNSRRKAV